MSPENADVHVDKARVLAKLNRFEEALIECDHAIELARDKSSGYEEKGDPLTESKQYIEVAVPPETSLITLTKSKG